MPRSVGKVLSQSRATMITKTYHKALYGVSVSFPSLDYDLLTISCHVKHAHGVFDEILDY